MPAPRSQTTAAEERDRPLTALELERIVPLDEVTRLTSLSADGLRRHHSHLIRQLSPRRVGMKLRDALAIGSGNAA
jgi:hypothetical protein